MGLSPDQEAMLQLMLERGQSYSDIAAVLGVGVDEVRSRSRAALTELAGSDPDAEVGLTDYLLGQADPIGRADAVRHLQGDPDARRLAGELIDRLRELAPAADLPELPTPREPRGLRRRKPEPKTEEPSSPTGAPGESVAAAGGPAHRLSRRQQQVIVALVASAVLVIGGVLALTGAFSGDGSDSTATAGGDGEVIETISLEPQAGADASGEARFGLGGNDEAFLELDLSGLSVPEEGSTYVVWLLITRQQGYPLSPIEVNDGGEFSDRLSVPAFAVAIASRARFVDISLSRNRSLLRDLERAVEDQAPILEYEGDSVLRGRIPTGGEGGGGNGGGSGG